ncbi:MAG: hypothetical protein NTX14_04415 [Candidatus Nealsonbacteria bacterium]|nr:hypothetical protein [Candidatus Nealsonbacteria bacterium]
MKKQFGQFFTTNSDYILRGMEKFIENKQVMDPFAGNRDLIRWANKYGCKKATGFDCDQNYTDNKTVFYNDSINNPGKYEFVCTNPPYLHKNKANTEIKDRFFNGIHSGFEDLYQISIFSILDSEEGILIVPLNFLCAKNSNRIRSLFFAKFEIVKLNIFSGQVFDDTTYNVISLYFRKKTDRSEKNKITALILPENQKVDFCVEKKYDWQLGGAFTNKVKDSPNRLGVFRLTESYLKSGDVKTELAFQNIKDKKSVLISGENKKMIDNNILFLRAIDSKKGKKIQLEDIREYGISGLVGKTSSRNMAHLIFRKELSINVQIELMNKFNKILNQERIKYSSFFLTNFRDNNRKRISFDFVYNFLNYLYWCDAPQARLRSTAAKT